MARISLVPTLVSVNDSSVPFPEPLALTFNADSKRYDLRFVIDGVLGDAVLEIEPHGGSWKVRPLANPGAGWLTESGWPVVSGYTKNP